MTSSRTRAVLASTGVFSALSLFPKVLAIAKDALVAARFGAAHALDIYLMAVVLIGVPVSIVVVALQTTLIPALVDKGDDVAAGLLGGAIKLAMILLVLALPVWLLALPRVPEILYPGREGAGHELLSACQWLIPYYFLNGINLLFYGALQARKVFWPNAVLPGLFPLAILIAVWLSPGSDIRSLLLGTVAGSALEGGALYLLVGRARLLNFRQAASSALLLVFRRALPLMVGGIIASLAPVIEQLVAFRLGPGAVSLLNYGNRVPAAVNSLFLTAIGIVVLPHFADLLAKREWQACKRLFSRLFGIALGSGALVAFIGIGLATIVVETLFEHGAFTVADARETVAIMRVYLLQLPFGLVAMISMRVLVAMGDTLIMTWIATGQLILAACLAYILSGHYGVVGVAIATVLGAVVGAAALGAAAWHRFRGKCGGPVS